MAGCYAHPTLVAIATCRGCFRPLCETCAINDSYLVPRCADCMRKRERRGVVLMGGAAVFLAALVVGALLVWRQVRREQLAERVEQASQPNYGNEAELVAVLRARIQKEPCDRKLILELGEALMRAGLAREALRETEGFFGKCGEHPRLRWVTYAAHRQLSEWDQAALEASKLIESDPYDADYRGWRGIMYERKGDFARAADDYRQALILRPGLTDLPLNLADAYVKLGQPCDAILPLVQAVTQHPNATNAGGVRARIAELASSPQCAWAAGEGEAVVKTKPGDALMIVKVRINDKETGEFIVDTGATLVVLSRDFADRVGLDTKGAHMLLAQTANGVSSGALVSLDKVEVQTVRAARVTAAVVEGLGKIDGLLGMSFLSRFDVRHNAGILGIKARKGAQAQP